jgi:hypothetical protein
MIVIAVDGRLIGLPDDDSNIQARLMSAAALD